MNLNLPNDSLSDRHDKTIFSQVTQSNEPRLETAAFCLGLGVNPTFVDQRSEAKDTIVLDLNMPLPQEFRGAYDGVFDSGTLEHCFNVGQAVANAAIALRVGGIVYHGNPLLMLNHGYFNFSPIFYQDFYEANGFTLAELFVLEESESGQNKIDVSSRKRFLLRDGQERVIVCIAQKTKEVGSISWPIQGKYS